MAMAWNSLPAATRAQIAANSNILKQLIKTHLFDRDKKYELFGTDSELPIRAPEKPLQGRWLNEC